MSSHFEVHQYSLCDGWTNNWTIVEDGISRPQIFSSFKEANEELIEHIEDLKEAYIEGFIEDDCNPDEYQIIEVKHEAI